MKIKFDGVESILYFVGVMDREEIRADVIGDRFYVKGNSLLGLLNVNFSEKYDLVLYGSENTNESVLKKIRNYVV